MRLHSSHAPAASLPARATPSPLQQASEQQAKAAARGSARRGAGREQRRRESSVGQLSRMLPDALLQRETAARLHPSCCGRGRGEERRSSVPSRVGGGREKALGHSIREAHTTRCCFLLSVLLLLLLLWRQHVSKPRRARPPQRNG